MVKAYLATALTHVRLLTSMDTLVNGQGRSLNELFTAVGIFAHVRTDAAMDTLWQGVSELRRSGVSRAQAPYHDVRGHCVEQTPSRKSSTGMLWVDPSRMRADPQVADSAGLYSAAVGTCDREG
jgi:hypothetical protein